MMKRILFSLFLFSLLTACGNKSALVLPDKPAPAAHADEPPATPQLMLPAPVEQSED